MRIGWEVGARNSEEKDGWGKYGESMDVVVVDDADAFRAVISCGRVRPRRRNVVKQFIVVNGTRRRR